MNECEKWLREFLNREYFILCDTVREEAEKQGFTRKQVKEARKTLGVETINEWAANEGKTLYWFWGLPHGGSSESL